MRTICGDAPVARKNMRANIRWAHRPTHITRVAHVFRKAGPSVAQRLGMKTLSPSFASLLIIGTIVGAASNAQAIPAFARRYGTSCQTCHIAFPKLTPFGEAFRRNGFKFPGQDEDFVKQDQVPLGQDAYKQMFPNTVWPGTLAASPPVAVGFNGTTVIHPTKSSSSAQADNGTRFTLQNLAAEAHLWAGGAFSEHIAYYGEVTFADGGTEIEHAELHFNDLGLSQHFVNLYVGRGVPSLTSFAGHSSFIADTILPTLAVTALYGASPDTSFTTMGQYNLVELNGMYRGRFIYSLGVNDGANVDTRTSKNVSGHLGFKLGGMRLDGENATGGTGDPLKPWEETALTVDVFGTRSASHFVNAADATMFQDDLTYVLGGHVRGTVGSFELNSGLFQEWHDHATDMGVGVKALAQYDELSYVVYPWFVPALRMEYISLLPDGGSRLNDALFVAGASFLVRPNLKLTLVGLIEHTNGAPTAAGWSLGTNGFAAPTAGATTEFEAINIGLAYAM
jgi:hypothetical protein